MSLFSVDPTMDQATSNQATPDQAIGGKSVPMERLASLPPFPAGLGDDEPTRAVSDADSSSDEEDSDEEDFVPPLPPTPPPAMNSEPATGYGKGKDRGPITRCASPPDDEEGDVDAITTPTTVVGKGKGKGGKGKGGKGKGKPSLASYGISLGGDPEVKRVQEARRAALDKVEASISDNHRNFKGNPYIIVDSLTDEETVVNSARQLIMKAVELLESEDNGEDLKAHIRIIGGKGGPQITLPTVTTFLVGFRVGDDETGAVVNFDKDQKPQDVSLGQPRFKVFHYDPEAEDGHGEEVEISGPARNMRVMGAAVWKKISADSSRETPFDEALVEIWGKNEYPPDKSTYSRRGRKTTGGKSKAKPKTPSKMKKQKRGEGDSNTTTKKRKLKKTAPSRGRMMTGQTSNPKTAGATLWHGASSKQEFSSWKRPCDAVAHAVSHMPDLTLEMAAKMILPFNDDFLLYDPKTREPVRPSTSGGSGDISSASVAATSGALKTFGFPTNVAEVLARAPSSSWPDISRALSFDNPDLVDAAAILRC